MDTKHTAAQPLDLDRLEALAKAAKNPLGPWYRISHIQDGILDNEDARYIAAAEPDTILALIAQARTARLDTTASASIDTPEFRAVMKSLLDAYDEYDESKPIADAAHDAWNRLIAYIDSRATLAPVAAQQAILHGDVVAGYTKWMNDSSKSPHVDDTRHPFEAFNAGVTFATVAAQQAAAVAAPSFWIGKDDADWLASVPDVNAKITALRSGGGSRVAVYLSAPTAVAATTSEDARDAARYRWLRAQDTSLETQQRDKGIVNGPSCYHEVDGIRELKWSDELDAAIDAAMAAQQAQASAKGESNG